MKKKLLSLLLVLCMILPMVPVGVITAVAAEGEGATVTFVNGDETVSTQTVGSTMDFEVPEVPSDAFGWYYISKDGSMREASTYLGVAAKDMTFYLLERSSTFSPEANWPLYTEGTSFDGWRGGWTAGYYNGNAFSTLDVWNNGETLLLKDLGGYSYIWGSGGIYLSTGRMATGENGHLALSYNALASGKIDIDFDDLGIYDNGLASNADIAMAIAVNGVIVWPTNNGTKVDKNDVFTYEGTSDVDKGWKIFTRYDGVKCDNWAYLALPGQEETLVTGSLLEEYEAYCTENSYPHGISVEAGDRVDIVVALVNSPHFTAFPTVTYTEVTSEPAKMTDPIGGVILAGEQDLASILVTNGENWPVFYDDPNVEAGNAGAWVQTSGFTGGWGFAGYTEGIIEEHSFNGSYPTYGNWQPGILWLDQNGGVTRTAFGENFQNTGAGFTYKVTSTGTMTANVSFNVDSIDTLGAVYYSIVKVNGKGATVVYPAEGADGAADVATEGAGIKYTSAGNMQEVATFEVADGDTLMFLFRSQKYDGEWWNPNVATNFRAYLSYVMPSSSFVTEDLSADENYKVPMPEGWQYVSYPAANYDASKMIVLDTLKDNNGGLITASFSEAWLMAADGDTYPRVNLMRHIMATSDWVWGEKGGIVTNNDWNTGLQYIAPYSGSVDINLDTVESTLDDAYIAVFVNGTMVWPKAGGSYSQVNDWYNLEGRTQEEVTAGVVHDALPTLKADNDMSLLKDVYVEIGDVIEILNKRVAFNGGNGTTIEASVAYNTLVEAPIVTGSSVTLGTDLSLNFYAQIIVPRGGAQMGMEYWTSEPTADMLAKGGTKLDGTLDEDTGIYTFTYSGLSAKQMADLVYVRPYSYVGEDVIYGDVKSFSIQAYAESAFGSDEKLDDVLYALLCYGANAQVLFDYNKTNLPNVNVPSSERVGSFEGELNNVYSNADGANKIKSVCLLLDNELGFKFMTDSVEGAESYELEFSYNADFSASEKVAMEAVGNGGEQKGIIRMSLADIGKTFYARVIVDGEAGATLTYSFDSYFARMQDNCSDALYFTLSSIATLDRALRAYLA